MKKVIHIVESLNRGAVENWLVRMFCHAQKKGMEFDWTFYCTIEDKGKLEPIVEKYRGKIIHSPYRLHQKMKFIKALRDTLKMGKYDVMHCHHDLVSAIYLMASAGINIPLRLVHVHNCDEIIPVENKLKQKIFRIVFRRICWAFADKNIGISNHTLDKFRLYKKRRKNIDIVHYYGIDPQPFETLVVDKPGIRKKLEIPENAIVLLFAGRIDNAKNPLFAIDVLAELIKIEPRTIGLFVGTGSLVSDMNKRAAELGITSKLYYRGWSNEIPEIMACSDLFILPHVESPKEGLGIAVIEAQLAMLPLLLSYGISDEPLLAGSKYVKLHLSRGAKVWAENAAILIENETKAKSFTALRNSVFDMDFALNDLISIYN